MERRISLADYIEELEALEEEYAEAAQANPLYINTDRLDAAVDARKNRLALEINFEDIKVGESVYMRDNRLMVVVEKGNNVLKLRKFGQTAGAAAFLRRFAAICFLLIGRVRIRHPNLFRG